MNYFVHIGTVLCLYLILSWSLNLVVGVLGALSLAQAAFYGIGAYVVAILMVDLDLSFWLATPLAAGTAMLLSLAVSLPALRFRNDYFVLASLAFQVIVFTILNNWFSMTRGADGISGIPTVGVFGYDLDSPLGFLILVAMMTALAGVLIAWLMRSPWGLALTAIREDELAAASLGKSVLRLKIGAFAVAAAFAALAGALFASHASYISPESFDINESILILCMVLIGGAGTFYGPAAGALVLVMLPEMLRLAGLPNALVGSVTQILYGLTLLAIVYMHPKGLLGPVQGADT